MGYRRGIRVGKSGGQRDSRVFMLGKGDGGVS